GARWTPHEQGYLSIRLGVLGQIVVDDERVLLVVAEELPHRAAGERRDVLHRRGIRCACDDHDGVVHRALFLEGRDDLRDRGLLAADRDVDAGEVLTFLVDDRVDADGALSPLTVADDELALTRAAWGSRVNRTNRRTNRGVEVLPA